jgi:hypothetical protein
VCRFENIGVLWSILLNSEEIENKHLITYSGQGIFVSSYLCIMEYFVVLWGESSKCRGFIIYRAILHNYHTTSWLQEIRTMLHIGVMKAYYHPSLCIFENIGVF